MKTSQLEGKVILVTGSQGQLGRSAVRMFLERGAFVAGCDLKSVQEYDELDEILAQYGSDRFMYMQANVCEEDSVVSVIEKIRDKYDRLDGSYHNVYVNRTGSIDEQSLQDFEASIQGTLTSTFLVCRHAARLMIDSGGGSIVNTSSILGIKAKVKNAAYCAGKAALDQFTRVMAIEYAPYGIRANVVVPGDFKSDEVLARLSQHHIDHMKNISAIGRSGSASEVNEVAAFLLSDAASYVTGSLYPVTGGIWL